LAPLISDMQKIRRAMPYIRANLKRLARNASAPKTVTSKCVGTISLNTSGLTGWSPSDNPNDATWWHTRVLPLALPTRIVGVRGVRAMKYQLDVFNQADYLMSRFLATGPASLVWEKIKFSFVVDWFVDLTGLIDLLDNTLVGKSKRIDRCWKSEKYHVYVPAYKHKHGQFTFYDLDGQQVTLSELKYYHREPMAPDPSIGSSGRFGKKQGQLSLALIYQMIANLKKGS
jgi:hypothetical protein